MELWATDTHCKAPIWHGKTPQPWLQPPQTHWKKVRKLDFAQKPRGGWKDEERKKGRWEKGWLDKWEAVHTNKGCYVAFVQVPQSYRTVWCMPLKRGSTTWGWVVTLIYSDREAFMAEPCNGMELVSECDGDCGQQWPILAASRAMWDSNTPRQELQARAEVPADWK